jgi:hypothetical protein
VFGAVAARGLSIDAWPAKVVSFMTSPSRHRPLVIGLYLNAALLLAILAAMISRGGGPSAFAAAPISPEPIAGGGSMYLMPAQFSVNTWGCYIMDIDTQTLCAYQFSPGEKELKLVAARYFHWDRRLGNFNTTPPWPDIQKLTEIEAQGVRANENKPPEPSPEAPNNQ